MPQWSDDVDRKLPVGGQVQGLLTVDVRLRNALSSTLNSWVSSPASVNAVQDIWNRQFKDDGMSTRVNVIAIRRGPSVAYAGYSAAGGGWIQPVELEVVGVVDHNLALAAWALIAILVVALTDATFNDGEILSISGKAVGSFIKEVIGGAVDAVAAPVGSLILGVIGALALLWLITRKR